MNLVEVSRSSFKTILRGTTGWIEILTVSTKNMFVMRNIRIVAKIYRSDLC